jgi:hypothetical protein
VIVILVEIDSLELHSIQPQLPSNCTNQPVTSMNMDIGNIATDSQYNVASEACLPKHHIGNSSCSATDLQSSMIPLGKPAANIIIIDCKLGQGPVVTKDSIVTVKYVEKL